MPFPSDGKIVRFCEDFGKVLAYRGAMTPAFEITFLTLQGLSTAFLFLHDWVPLGRFSNPKAMRGEDSLGKRIFVTLLGAAPAALALGFCVRFYGRMYPHGVVIYLWIMYGTFLYGILQAWWIPYWFGTDPERAERYRVIFAGTHRFLPERHGMSPDTLHTLFHLCVLATAVMLFLRGRM